MNCKPKDLAVVIKPFGFRAEGRSETIVSKPPGQGLIVRVMHLGDPIRGVPCWVLEKPIEIWLYWANGAPVGHHDALGRFRHRGMSITAIDDHCLRPLPSADDVEDFDEAMERSANAWRHNCGCLPAPIKEST